MDSSMAFDGYIAGAAFTSGHRIVVGCWKTSSFGAFADVMWADPDGRRVLLGAQPDALAFVEEQYSFEETRLVPIAARVGPTAVSVKAGGLTMDMELAPAGLASLALGMRPPWLRAKPRWIEWEERLGRPLASSMLGGAAAAHLTGTTVGGLREWYSIHDLRFARVTHASVDGKDAGEVDLRPSPARFGFSEVPARPSIVRVTSRFAQPI